MTTLISYAKFSSSYKHISQSLVQIESTIAIILKVSKKSTEDIRNLSVQLGPLEP